MVYEHVNDLPMTLRETLPEDAQEIYRTTYNQVWAEHAHLDETPRASLAHQLAWDAIQREYTYVQDSQGEAGGWYRIGEEPDLEAREQKQGLLARLGLR